MLCILSCKAQNQIIVGSFNIRCPSTTDNINGNDWHIRMPHMCRLIRFYEFDIIGLQEVYKSQLDSLAANLKDYSYIGSDIQVLKATGVYNSIFYNKNKFILLDQGDFWLSETPDKPSKGWDAKYVRMCSWGIFRVKATNDTIYFCNIHLDNVGAKSRAMSAKLVADFINKKRKQYPVILVGDLNSNDDSDAYRNLTTVGHLADTYTKAEMTYMPAGTYNGFKFTQYNKARYDYVFVTNDFDVKRWMTITDYYWQEQVTEEKLGTAPKTKKIYIQKTPSDHYPVMVKLRLKK